MTECEKGKLAIVERVICYSDILSEGLPACNTQLVIDEDCGKCLPCVTWRAAQLLSDCIKKLAKGA